MMKRLLVITALVSWTSLAYAQDDVQAFASAIAPEQAFETCHADDPIKAAQCALDKCKAATGDSEECVIINACSRGWAGAMGVTTGEIHWTESVCGAPTEAAVVASLKAFCDGGAPHVQECFMSSVWSPDGKEKQFEQTWQPNQLK